MIIARAGISKRKNHYCSLHALNKSSNRLLELTVDSDSPWDNHLMLFS